jgi:hypothetical protein
MKEKILLVAVAASAGYAGGQIGRTQAGPIEATQVVVTKPSSGVKTIISPDGIFIGSTAEETQLPMAVLKVAAPLPGRKTDAYMMLLGGPASPAVVSMAGQDRAVVSVGLANKNEIKTEYQHGVGSMIWRLLDGGGPGRSRKLVAD